MREVLLILAILFILFHTFLRFLDSLHMYQQNIYDFKRYYDWIIHHTAKVLPVLDIMPLIIWLSLFFFPKSEMVFVLLVLTAVFYTIQSLVLFISRKKFTKKPLVYTARVKRLMLTSFLLTILFFIASFYIYQYSLLNIYALILIYMIYNLFVYILVLLANIINMPIEKYIQHKFIREACEKMLALKDQLHVIGITGSYGKTTTKNIVHHLLNEQFYALMSPASYNTPMGLTITIRALLKPIHQVFVAEMGAYKPGDIKELTDLVMPTYGILTSIGPQHLNTFKTIENVQQTKFELIESIPSEGLAILNIDDPNIQNYHPKRIGRTVTYSIQNEQADFYAKDIVYMEIGTEFTVIFPNKEEYRFSTKLLGEHNIENILAALAVAYDLKMDPLVMIEAIKTLPQVEHRLELKKMGNYTIIDDAFNANPVGTKKAIDVLAKMPGKKIVMTPGMIELGSEQDQLNKEYGQYMVDKVDFVILVGKEQTKSILDGLLENKFPQEKICIVDHLQDAFQVMYQQITDGSFVLIANDLPDIYNK